MSIHEHLHVSEEPRRFDVFTGEGRRRPFTVAEKAAIIEEATRTAPQSAVSPVGSQ